jgi:hypothetical protein
MAPAEHARGFTVRDLAARWRVSADKIRAWILRGELSAINTANHLSGKPRFVVSADAVAAFERGRGCATPPRPTPRRKRAAGLIDYFPD